MKSVIQTTLDENIPKDCISTRSQAGAELSYLEAWYVIDRMNQVLGQGNWGYQLLNLNKVFEGKTTQKSGEVFATSYTAAVQVFANIEGKQILFSDIGFGNGTHRTNPGEAHELATKGAVSDGFKRAAKNLGRSMGLALYDKTQEYVGTNSIVQDAIVAAPKIQPMVSNTPKESDRNAESGVKSNTGTVQTVRNLRPVKELITAAFKALEAQGKTNAKDFKAKYQGGIGISQIPIDKLSVIYDNVCKDFNL